MAHTKSPALESRDGADKAEAANLNFNSTIYRSGKTLLHSLPRRGAIRLHPVEPMHVETLRACGFDPAYIGLGLYAIWERVPGEGRASDA